MHKNSDRPQCNLALQIDNSQSQMHLLRNRESRITRKQTRVRFPHLIFVFFHLYNTSQLNNLTRSTTDSSACNNKQKPACHLYNMYKRNHSNRRGVWRHSATISRDHFKREPRIIINDNAGQYILSVLLRWWGHIGPETDADNIQMRKNAASGRRFPTTFGRFRALRTRQRGYRIQPCTKPD